MPTRLPFLLTLVWLVCDRGSAVAQPPPKPSAKPRAVPYASMVRLGADRPAMVIDYPWKAHARASVEVRPVTGEGSDPPGMQPLRFAENYLRGELILKVQRALDDVTGRRAALSVTKEETHFDIHAGTNSLGKRSIYVTAEVPGAGATSDWWVAYCYLQSWALNDGLLYLDLPEEQFTKPGKLHVWFLRGDDILWKQQVDWARHGK